MGNPHPVDVLVGQRLKELRTKRGLSQAALANRVNLSYQQIKKYEEASNRMSASMLYDMAEALEVGILEFYKNVNAPATYRKVLRYKRAANKKNKNNSHSQI